MAAGLIFGHRSVLGVTCEAVSDTIVENAPKAKQAIGDTFDLGLDLLQMAQKATLLATTGAESLEEAIKIATKDRELLQKFHDRTNSGISSSIILGA